MDICRNSHFGCAAISTVDHQNAGMFAANNVTLFGIHNQSEKLIWICYLLTVLLSALVGDTIILIAATKYDAFKLNKVIVVSLQHIAVCDLILSVAYVLPPMISIIADGWILGTVWAYLEKGIIYITFPTSTLLICILTISKLLLLYHPIKFRNWTKKRAHIICGLCWLLSVLNPLTIFIKSYYEKEQLYFNYQTYDVYYKKGKVSSLILGSVYCLVTVVIIVATILTLRFLLQSKRQSHQIRGRQTVRWRGTLTVVLTASIYSISLIPWILYEMMEFDLEDDLPAHTQTLLKRITTYITMINVMSNIYIYAYAVPSFRNFIWSGIRSWCMKIKVLTSCNVKRVNPCIEDTDKDRAE